MIFNEDDALFILVELRSDQISPRESAKIGRMGAQGLVAKFLSILSSYLKSTIKIMLGKNHVSMIILKFP